MNTTALPCFALLILLVASAFTSIDTKSFYKVFSGGEEQALDQAIAALEKEGSSSRNNAYIGALTMKKAGFVKGVGGKLKTFRKGAAMLDEQIKGNPSVAEYRFLRLTIQEHAPGILKYNKELDEDKAMIVRGFSRMEPALKTVVANYAKDSDVLKAEDLK